MPYYIPAEYGSEDLALDALVALLNERCGTEVATGDMSRAQIVKAGYRQESPASVSIMLYENDPDDPKQHTHRPVRDSALVGGGNRYARAFTMEVEVHGRYMPQSVTREESRRIASIVVRRAMRALLHAGPKIGQDREIADDFGETLVNGPFFGRSWADVNEGESLIVRKYVRFWYETAWSWDTDGW